MAYFDYNATTPLNPAARQVFVEALDSHWENPSSPYLQSARVHNALEASRIALGTHLGKPSDEVVFTGGATEANNSVMRYLVDQLPAGKTIALSPFEHPSVLEAAKYFFGDRILFLRADDQGKVDLVHFFTLLNSESIGAVSVMAVNNETGVAQPWEEISKRCHEAGILYHCDASQWFGKFPDGDFSSCDFLVGCGHKFGGPKGVGFLGLSKNSTGFRSQLGGGQESGKRGGTENVPAILAMVAALEYAESTIESLLNQQPGRDKFEDFLQAKLPDLKCIGKSATRVANTSFLLLPRFENIRWVRKLDTKGFQLSTGSACSTGETGTSSVLSALGFDSGAGRRTIRVSAGPDTTSSDWEGLTEAFLQVWHELKQSDSASGMEIISV